MKFSVLPLIFLLLGYSLAEVKNTQSRSFLSPVGDFFKGIWNRLLGKHPDPNTAPATLRPNTSLEDTMELVSDKQWDDIGKTRNKVIRDAIHTPALSELMGKVRDNAGPSLNNLTDYQLTDVLYAMTIVDKLADQQGAIDALKIFSLNIPLLPMLIRDIGYQLSYLFG